MHVDVAKAMAKRETDKEVADAKFYTQNRDTDGILYKKQKEIEAQCMLPNPCPGRF